jgi:GNAT superfamily N-acetyltransferase
MAVTYAWESFHDGCMEALPIMRRHFEEVQNWRAEHPFDPQWPYYFQCENAGLYHVLVARDNGKMIGYCGIFATPMLHTQRCIRARTDSYYVDPAYRGQGVATAMFREVERKARELGVHRLEIIPKVLGDKPTFDPRAFDPEYQFIEATFGKVLK